MDESQTPIWYPITKLPLIASLIDQQLESCEEQLQNLAPPGRKAPVLDDALVTRIFRVYTEQQEMLPVYAEQLARWKEEDPAEKQRAEIERLERQLERYVIVIKEILGLAREHERFTIEKVMGKDDGEVGLDFLLGKMDRWL